MFHDVTNNFNVMGRMTRELEVKTFPSGGRVGTFSVCHNGGYKGKDGNWVEKPSFIEVKVHGDVMDFIAKNCPKGTLVFISGPVEQENWDAPDGQKRSRLVVNLVSIKKMPTGEKKEVGGNDEAPKANAAPAGKKPAATRKPANTAPVEETPPPKDEEDIPF